MQIPSIAIYSAQQTGKYENHHCQITSVLDSQHVAKLHSQNAEVLASIQKVSIHLSVVVSAKTLQQSKPIRHKSNEDQVIFKTRTSIHLRNGRIKPISMHKVASHIAYISKRYNHAAEYISKEKVPKSHKPKRSNYDIPNSSKQRHSPSPIEKGKGLEANYHKNYSKGESKYSCCLSKDMFHFNNERVPQ